MEEKDKVSTTEEAAAAVAAKKGFRKANIIKYAIALFLIAILAWFGFTCQVKEGECAVILRFGAVRKEITEAGLYAKLPWPFETVVSYDDRLQYLESSNLETTTKDKRNIIIKSYVVWEIDAPLLYHNSVGTSKSVESYINDQVFSATNSTLGGYELKALVSLESEEIKLDEIQQEIFTRIHDNCLANYGVDVKDVSILRLSLPDTNLTSVFEQMWADRQKDIDIIMSKAYLEANKITSDANSDAAEIEGQGTADAAAIKARTETEVAKIYAQAQAANVDLYKFLTNLDTMVKSINYSTVLVVKADQYPFSILTDYSKQMSAEGEETVLRDLNYILSRPELPEADRTALINAIAELIAAAANSNGITMPS